MLKLLPPLLVVCVENKQHGFNKELYDSFRPTWDDTKGLVGNCEKPQIHNQWDSSTNQDLAAKVYLTKK